MSLRVCLLPMLALLLASQAAQGAANKTTVGAAIQPLDFGSFVVLPTCTNCTIVMSPSGMRSTPLGGILLTSKNAGRPAQFNVTCNNGSCPYTATFTTSVNMTAGGVTMRVGSFTIPTGSPTTPNLLSVGGTLTIPRSGSTPATYTSPNFSVTTSP